VAKVCGGKGTIAGRVWELDLLVSKDIWCLRLDRLCSFNVLIDKEVKAERETPQLGLLIYLLDNCLSIQIKESYTCVSQRIGSDVSHLTHRAYVSGPYWSVRDRWQIVHISDTYDTGKMKIKCNLYVTTRNSWFTGHKDYVLSVAVLHDGQWVVSCSKDRGGQFWDKNRQAQLMLQGHKSSGECRMSY